MTQEEKQLLLQDLCARLPYGVKIYKTLYGAITLNERDIESFRKGFDDILKPYLRPMSSMTEDERKDFRKFQLDYSNITFDWFNAHHFDVRHLIERGLAIEVTEENNPIRVGTNIEWIDMDTLEAYCYNCCLFDNGCKDISLCKRPTNTYKGFYIEKK